MTVEELPDWLHDEIQNPAGDGERNAQLIRIGPSLVRAGMTLDEVGSVFEGMQPDLPEREIATLVRQAGRYAQCVTQDAERAGRGKLAKGGHLSKQARVDILAKYKGAFARLVDPTLTKMPDNQQRQEFLSRMFNPHDVVWCGMVWDSGKPKHASHFRFLQRWLAAPRIPGEYTSHSVYAPETFERINERVAMRRFLVVESDDLDPDDTAAVFEYLVAERGFTLRAMVHSGNASVHGWFDWPGYGPETCQLFGAMLKGLGCDPATLKASQPVRLPGCVRKDTGKRQQLLKLV